jgi:hypothetical protein
VPEFDVESDPAFLRSLSELGEDVADATIVNLFHVAAGLNWSDFVRDYDWREHTRQPIDTYPGAIEYWRFQVPMPAEISQRPPDFRTHVHVFALNQLEQLVLCAVAQ